MNDKIKKLAERAFEESSKELAVTDPACYYSDKGPDIDIVFEKFAELIVRECMAQIKEVKELSLPYNANREQAYEFGYDDGMTVAVRTIEEHFGVEE